MKNKQVTAREEIIRECENIIVKVGTRLLTDTQRIAVFIAGINSMRKKGKKVLLVTSGAVGLGMQQLGLKKRPTELSEVQALAAIGQSKLMGLYEQECRKFGFLPAQLLLTADDLRDRERHLNVLNCINSMTRSKLTIILTTEEGLREKVDGKLAGRVSLVEKIDENLKSSASGTDNSTFSIGGMISKLRAAEMVNTAGDYLWIADGRQDSTLEDILKAKDIGTLFVPAMKARMDSKKRWIKYFARCHGKITVDAGAAEAVKCKGRSLLPSGITGISGKFKRGDTLEISGPDGKVIGRGLSNFSSEECALLMGVQSSEIKKILKRDADDEIIHRNNLAVVA